MTNVDTDRQNTSFVDKKVRIGILTGVFPWKYGYARRLADRLNKSEKKSIMGFEYTANIVRQVKDKGYEDPNVEPELVKMVEEFTGKPIALAAPEYASLVNQTK